jgi:hypothetical protein
MFALGFGKPLLFLAFGALPIHFASFDVFTKKQTATGTFLRIPLANFGAATGRGADEDGLAATAPEFPSFQLFADRAFFHGFPSTFFFLKNSNIDNGETKALSPSDARLCAPDPPAKKSRRKPARKL